VLDITEKSRIEGQTDEAILTNDQLCIIFAVCHAMGMLSACANPIIYGFLNENFHREFVEIFNNIHQKLSCHTMGNGENNVASSPNLRNGSGTNGTLTSSGMRHILCCCRGKSSDCCKTRAAEMSDSNNMVPLEDLANHQISPLVNEEGNVALRNATECAS